MLVPVAANAGGLSEWLGISGDDGRDAVRFNGGWPWVAVGRLDLPNGGHCSATLIERDRILTAAHCLADGDGGHVDPAELVFWAGLDDGSSRASARGRHATVESGLELDAAGMPVSFEQDWAIVELDRQLYDGGWLRPVPLASRDDALHAAGMRAELAQAGYSGDQRENLTRNKVCRSLGQIYDGRMMLHDCDATFGDSGSPVMLVDGGDAWIAGVHVAVGRVEGRSVGMAVILPDEAHW